MKKRLMNILREMIITGTSTVMLVPGIKVFFYKYTVNTRTKEPNSIVFEAWQNRFLYFEVVIGNLSKVGP